MFRLLDRLLQHHRDREAERDAIAQAHDEARRAGDEPEKTMSDTVFEEYDKHPDGGWV